MSQAYALHVLKVAVAKICQTIGWHSTHTTTIDLLIDVTQHFLRDISRIMMRYCELYNRTEPNLNDLALAYRDMSINIQELMEYIQFVDPIPMPFAVPRFPLRRESNLNFLKPGSREMMTRPLHIPWYMPPMFPELEDDAHRPAGVELGAADEPQSLVRVDADRAVLLCGQAMSDDVDVVLTVSDAEVKMVEGATLTEITIDETGEKLETGETITLGEEGTLPPEALVNEEVEIPMQTLEIRDACSSVETTPLAQTNVASTAAELVNKQISDQQDALMSSTVQGDAPGEKGNAHTTAADGRPTRNISSFFMTTSGFISPAREGKLPVSRIPIIPEEQPPPRMLQPSTTATGNAQIMLSVSGAAATGTPHSVTASSSLTNVGSSAHSLPLGSTPISSKQSSASSATGGLTSGGGIPFVSSSASGKTVGGGEKGNKKEKQKKKPADRERKKGEKKGTASAMMFAAKGDKLPESDKLGIAKPPKVIESVSGGKDTTGIMQPFATPFHLMPPTDPTTNMPRSTLSSAHFPSATPDPNASQMNALVTPFLQPGETSMQAVKLAKPPKTKPSKESKALKKRKAAPEPTDPGAMAWPGKIQLKTPQLIEKLPAPAKQPKVKSSKKQAKKLQTMQMSEIVTPALPGQALLPPAAAAAPTAGAHQEQPLTVLRENNQKAPPLIDPFRGGSLFGERLSLPNTAIPGPPGALPHEPAKAHGAKQPKAPADKQSKDGSTTDQLSLLQLMHPSLEITASPALDQPPKQTGADRQSGSVKQTETPFHMPMQQPATPLYTTQDGVVVISDDKSSAHASPLVPKPAASENKKSRKRKEAALLPPSTSINQAHGPDEGNLTSSAGTGANSTAHARHAPSSTARVSESDASRFVRPTSTTLSEMYPEMGEERKKTSDTATVWNPVSQQLGSAPVEKKAKRPKQKQTVGSSSLDARQAAPEPPNQEPPFGSASLAAAAADTPGAGRNPFSLFGPPGPGLTPYGSYINSALGGPRMPFGIFPFPSGPGLIPDFPIQPGTYPMGPGSFPLPPNPFGLPDIGQLNSMMRMPRPLTGRNALGSGGLNPYQNMMLDDGLDPETKLAQTPLDLQKSNCNVAPLVPPSLFQAAHAGNDSLSFPMKFGGQPARTSQTPKKSQSSQRSATVTSATVTSTSASNNQTPLPVPNLAESAMLEERKKQPQSRRAPEDQVVILPAASVLLGASPPQRPSMCVIDVDDSDDSQSTTATTTTAGAAATAAAAGGAAATTTTTTGADKEAERDGRRKMGKEHKKERKIKEGKIKKKKDKKEKNRSKEREREQQLKELTAGTASSSAVLTMGMIGAEEALLVQLRKERKEKKDKRKDKPKKEKRKERERMLQQQQGASEQPALGASGTMAAGTGTAAAVVSSTTEFPGEHPVGGSLPVPKIIMKLGGSATTASPRSDTPEQYQAGPGPSGIEQKQHRDGSPELARISALVTRPPKLKLMEPGGPAPPAGGYDTAAAAASGRHHAFIGAGPIAGEAGSGEVTSTAGKGMGGVFGTGPGAAVVPAGKGGSSKAAARSGLEYGASSGAGSSKGFSAAGETGGSRKAPKEGSSSSSKGGSKSSSSSSSAAAAASASASAVVAGLQAGGSAHHHHHHHHAGASTIAAPAHMTDADGNTVWICPACGRVDDGTPMIGCDGCDAWYHWVCVGIQVPPDDNEDWYCRVCIGKKQDSHADAEKQRKRKKKDKKTAKD